MTKTMSTIINKKAGHRVGDQPLIIMCEELPLSLHDEQNLFKRFATCPYRYCPEEGWRIELLFHI